MPYLYRMLGENPGILWLEDGVCETQIERPYRAEMSSEFDVPPLETYAFGSEIIIEPGTLVT